MNINNHHCKGGVELMNGKLGKVHLHREWCQVINIGEDLFSDENLRHKQTI